MHRHPIPPRCAGGHAARRVLAAVLLVTATLWGCNDPQSPTPGTPSGDTEYQGAYDGSRGIEFQLESPRGSSSPLQLVASNLVFDAGTQELHAQVAVHNTGSEAVAGPDQILVGSFVPEGVRPQNALDRPCPMCPNCPCPWPWAYDHHGTYGEDGMLAPGETSTPVEWIFLDPDGASFAFRAQPLLDPRPASGTISGSVFVDANGDGRRDNTEPGIAGAAITLVHGDVATGATTDPDGRYSFAVTEEGLYVVGRESTATCDPTTPPRLQVVIVRRPDGSLSGFDHADFGCRGEQPPVDIAVGGLVFEDLNRDGLPQPGEHGIPGILVTGAAIQCPTFAAITVRTDERGRYILHLPPCEPPYVVGHETPAGFVDTSPNPIVFGGSTDPDSTPGGPPMPPHPSPPIPRLLLANFGMVRTDAPPPPHLFIEGVVFRDANHNGRRDDGEPGIPSVGVTASGLECLTPVAAFTHTDENGHYRLDGADVHCPLPWGVASEVPASTCGTTPNPVAIHRPPPDGSDIVRVDFGFTDCDSIPPPPPGRFAIEGVVFVDMNRDGRRDPGESGVPGADLVLLSPCDAVPPRARTDLRGHYRFTPEQVGFCPVIGVELVAPEFPLHTTPNPAPVDPATVPGDVLVVDFGVARARGTP